MLFQVVAWLDTFDLAASLPAKMGLFGKVAGLRTLPIRGYAKGTAEADEKFVTYGPAGRWVELTSLRGKIKRLGEVLGGVEIGLSNLEMLDPGAALPWERQGGAYYERWQRVRLAIRTNPGVALLAATADGTETFSPPPGALHVVPAQLLCSAVNLGQTPAVALIVDFRRHPSDSKGQ